MAVIKLDVVTGKNREMTTILFHVYGLFFSMMNCSYGVVPATLPKPVNERIAGAAWRQGGYIGLIAVYGGSVPVMNFTEGNSKLAISAVTLFSPLAQLFMWICYRARKECYVGNPTYPAKAACCNARRNTSCNRLLFILCIPHFRGV